MAKDNTKDDQNQREPKEKGGCCGGSGSKESSESCCAQERAHEGEVEVTVEDPIAELESRAADAEARALRTLADYQNFQKRAANNEVEARRQGITGTIMALLPVMDNFDIALGQDVSKMSAEQLLGGVEMVRAEFERALGNQGVSAIKPQKGDEFDAGLHEAVTQQPSDEVEPGRIIESFQTGYKLGDRVLRPAKVVIATEPPSEKE